MEKIFYFTDIISFQKYAVLEKIPAGDSIQLKQGLFIVDEGFVSYECPSKNGNKRCFGVKDTILHMPTKYTAEETGCVLWYLPEVFVDFAKQSEQVSRLLSYAFIREYQWLEYLQSSNVKEITPCFIHILRFEDIYRKDYEIFEKMMYSGEIGDYCR
ncbi:hypothetical protein HB852_07465 [Listeria grandensis]|uniref:Uncharacterized protein n=1 Tax=Listeria grandensis TaxID=1494963 RepID=A0A7X0Y6D9_9LIST|nr:hypothetical protein [Listeria grandensis]MBC1474453.1 hypothetical protein [Listeria grandensis]MBC1937835.1 hypothetical protein [Listeria grandensis]